MLPYAKDRSPRFSFSKYVNHQPRSSREGDFRRLGAEIPVSAMVGWVEAAAEKLLPIVEEMRKRIRDRPPHSPGI